MNFPSKKSRRDIFHMTQYLKHPIDSTLETLKTRKLIQEDKCCRICQHQKPIKFSFYCTKKEHFVLPYAVCVDHTTALIRQVVLPETELLKEGETK